MLRRVSFCAAALMLLALPATGGADPVTFTPLTHTDTIGLLPQPKGVLGQSGDHLVQTPDDITTSTLNPDGCFSFNFTNPAGEDPPDYPPGYAEAIHSMTGLLELDIDLQNGGTTAMTALSLEGHIAPNKYAYQYLVNPGDSATDGQHGPADGVPNTYAASAASNWELDLTLDWHYDTPFHGHPSIDMTFNNYQWTGFVIPVSELTAAGMQATTLDDPLGYFGGGSESFESWLLEEVVPCLPPDATYLLFAQGEANPDWMHPDMGMTTDGIVAETIIAYTTVPEPGILLLVATGLGGALLARRAKR